MPGRSTPKSYFVYEFSYPEGMEDIAGIVFYVGKGTGLSRMNAHFAEASRGCSCTKCSAIRSVWDAGLVVVRHIVFESLDEHQVLHEEAARIQKHTSPYLTNVLGVCGRKRASRCITPSRVHATPTPCSLIEEGEAWILERDAFPGYDGATVHTLVIDGYGNDLSSRVFGTGRYYLQNDLIHAYQWVRDHYPDALLPMPCVPF